MSTIDTHVPANGLTVAVAVPDQSDPIRLAGITVKAVDRIGEAAAIEIEEAATALENAASQISTKLRSLAKAVRDHSQIAGEHVAGFCKQSTEVIETVRVLQLKLDGKGNGDGDSKDDAPKNDPGAAPDSSPAVRQDESREQVHGRRTRSR